MQIPANDFARQWEDLGTDAMAAIDRVGRSGWLVLGKEVEEFERELASWWGAAHAVGVASGLDALEIGLRCAGIEPGDRVLTTPLTAFATTLAILRAGGEPVWCDVEESGGMDLDRADAALGSDPTIAALLPVHLYGHPLDPDRLVELSADHEVALIEDCAQSAGAERGGRATGLSGVAAGVSLYPTKNLGAMGDGGVLLTEDAAVAERARSIRDYGQRERYEHAELGLNSRLDEVQAAVLRSASLPRLDSWLERRREIAERYAQALEGSALRPVTARGGRSGNHLFPVEVVEGNPDEAIACLRDRGVAVGRHYPFICPEQPAAAGRGLRADALEVASRVARTELSLPIHPYLTDEEVDAVIKASLAACA